MTKEKRKEKPYPIEILIRTLDPYVLGICIIFKVPGTVETDGVPLLSQTLEPLEPPETPTKEELIGIAKERIVGILSMYGVSKKMPLFKATGVRHEIFQRALEELINEGTVVEERVKNAKYIKLVQPRKIY